jgi:hypothetical protein
LSLINKSPTDFAPIQQLQLMRFKGEKRQPFGDISWSSCLLHALHDGLTNRHTEG